MQRQDHQKPDEHHQGIEDVEVDLVVCDVPVPALAKLNQPEDVPDEKESDCDVQTGIDWPEGWYRDAVHGGCGHVEECGEEEEDDNDQGCQSNDEQNAPASLAVIWPIVS